MRISDWSSDVCSSDLSKRTFRRACIQIGLGQMVDGRYTGPSAYNLRHTAASIALREGRTPVEVATLLGHAAPSNTLRDRKSGVSGKSVSVGVDLVGRRIIKKKKKKNKTIVVDQ